MSRMDTRDYDNDYQTQKGSSVGYSRSQPKDNGGGDEDKPLSASDITAIAESTVNQLLQRDERRERRSRDRRRSRSRSRDRGRSRSPRRSRSRERRRSRERSSAAKSTSGSSTMNRLEKLKDPRIVTLKGLKSFHKENDIRRELTEERMRFRDIRVIFNKANQSGTAFVEFQSESEAAKWVRNNRGMLKVREEYLTMDLNKPLAEPKKDWTCKSCGEKNHYARESCYSCQREKPEDEEKPRLRSTSPVDGKDQDNAPSNVLMIRGLDYRTTEEQVHRRLRDLTKVPIKDVRLITDKYTNKSRGFCFVEVSSIADGKELMNRISRLDPPFEISSRKVTVTYQREPGEKNEMADAAIAAAQWSASTRSDLSDTVGQTPAATAAPQSTDTMPETIGSYVWDDKTGYYYDQSSGLYYDPKTKYYYNPTDEKYYCWDEANQKYETVTPNNQTKAAQNYTDQTATDNSEGADKSKPTVNKVAKAMNAKKIQKDMERWAKAKNKQQAKANPPKSEVSEDAPIQETPPLQTGNSIALKIAQDYADPVYQQSQQPVQVAPPPPSIFPITNMAIPTSLTDDQINRKYEDLTAMACLLCKRKFPSIENLRRHQELSDLHKTSLAAERQKTSGGGNMPPPSDSGADYRDRAAERRNKFGNETPSGQPPNKFMRR